MRRFLSFEGRDPNVWRGQTQNFSSKRHDSHSERSNDSDYSDAEASETDQARDRLARILTRHNAGTNDSHSQVGRNNDPEQRDHIKGMSKFIDTSSDEDAYRVSRRRVPISRSSSKHAEEDSDSDRDYSYEAHRANPSAQRRQRQQGRVAWLLHTRGKEHTRFKRREYIPNESANSEPSDSSDDENTDYQYSSWESKMNQDSASRDSNGVQLFRQAMEIPPLPGEDSDEDSGGDSDEGSDEDSDEGSDGSNGREEEWSRLGSGMATTIAVPVIENQTAIQAPSYVSLPTYASNVSIVSAGVSSESATMDNGATTYSSTNSSLLVPATSENRMNRETSMHAEPRKREEFIKLTNQVVAREYGSLNALELIITQMLKLAEDSNIPERLCSHKEMHGLVSALLVERSRLEEGGGWSEDIDEQCARLVDLLKYDHDENVDDIDPSKVEHHHDANSVAVGGRGSIHEHRGNSKVGGVNNSAEQEPNAGFSTERIPNYSVDGSSSSLVSQSATKEDVQGRATTKLFENGYRGYLYKLTKHKKWVLRFFILTPKGELRSCKSDKAKHATGTRSCLLAGVDVFLCINKGDACICGHRNVFTVEHSDPSSLTRGFTLSAPSADTRQTWIWALSKFVSVG